MTDYQMNLEKRYHAKLMLAGEYGVIAGSEALTVPLKNFHARLAHRDEKEVEDNGKVVDSVSSLRELLIHIRSLPKNSFYATPDFQKVEYLLKKGFFIDSTIPQGYGIGSSGAVSALVYDQFFSPGKKPGLPHQLRDLATIESAFHGKSSGVDAMTSLMDTPLHFNTEKQITKVKGDPLKPPGGYRFFLLDSEQFLKTAPLVEIFLDKMKEISFQKMITEDYFGLIRKFIATITGNTGHDAALIFRAISDFQWNQFRMMIPETIEDAWIEGQVSNTYYLKINGSGGGFLLGIAHENSKEMVEDMLVGKKIIWV
ncbi:MAG: hypothetical protein WD052_11090 [Bacteroidales bacterium]